jgi:hypothetical protein
LEERLSITEEDLMEEFIEDTLSPKERELFRKNFLASGRRKREIAYIFLLKRYAVVRAGILSGQGYYN